MALGEIGKRFRIPPPASKLTSSRAASAGKWESRRLSLIRACANDEAGVSSVSRDHWISTFAFLAM
jgi:hypothetical protein